MSVPAPAALELLGSPMEMATFGGIAANLQLVVLTFVACAAMVASVALLYRWKNRPSG